MEDLQEFRRLYDDVLQTEHGRIRTLRDLLNSAKDALSIERKLSETLTVRVLALRAAQKKRKRWQRFMAFAALVVGVASLGVASRLDHGFGELLLEAAGAALLTYVLIDIVVNRITSITDDAVAAMEESVTTAMDTGAKMDELCRLIETTIAGLPAEPELPNLPGDVAG
ncbi:MAG TPA: hypothetical protein VGN51_16020 [Acidimicrobiia bacterium]